MKTLAFTGVWMMLALLAGSAQAALRVVATTADFGAIAREIGGDKVEVTVLARPAEDPHFVDPKPSFVARLSRADLLLEGGAELESGWLPPLLEGARNAKLAGARHVACAEGVALLEVPARLDRAQGDLHAMGNPHFMTDPVNGGLVAGRITEALAAADPAQAEYYRGRLAAFKKQLDEKLSGWEKQLAPYRGFRVAAFHNSWLYFGQRFGLKIDLFLEPKPGIPPTPAHLAEVIGTMRKESIRAVIMEPYENRKTAERVVEETGAALVAFAQYPGGVKGTEGGYLELIDYLVQSLASALGKPAAEKAATP